MAVLAFLGLPSLHEIVEAIANGFFGALANALVPGWLKHGSVATIQHLVALPDPAEWTHVGQLQGDMVYLGAMLLPVTLAVGTVRYWLVGLTGAAHPVGALGRCAWVTLALVAYRWFVEQAVAATNTLTHGILGLPVVADGLQRIIGVLFGGALLGGAGGVFGAFLVIIGVLFAAGLFAAQVLLTVMLALLIVAGPPLIALSAIPELSHLARTWAHALLAIALVPLGWTVLFATAGALALDATSFTGGAGGLPAHVAAAFAGLITFVIAVKLPLMLLGELRHLFGAASFSRTSAASAPGQSTMPGTDRVRAAHARLRSVAFDAVPSLGASAGRAAGALGAPRGGPLGAAARGLAGAAQRSGILPAAAAGDALGGSLAGGAGRSNTGASRRRGVRERLRDAGMILLGAPREARSAMRTGTAETRRSAAARAAGSARTAGSRRGSAPGTGDIVAVPAGARNGPPGRDQRAAARRASRNPQRRVSAAPQPSGGAGGKPAREQGPGPDPHPGRKVTTGARREASGQAAGPARASKPAAAPNPKRRTKPPAAAPAPREAKRKPSPPTRRPRPRSGS